VLKFESFVIAEEDPIPNRKICFVRRSLGTATARRSSPSMHGKVYDVKDRKVGNPSTWNILERDLVMD
jgi:hypothetical protein